MTPTSLVRRPLGPGDDERLLDLVEACDIADIGEPDYTLDDLRHDLGRPEWVGWALEDGAGRLRAYCWMERRGHDTHLDGDVRVHPEDDAALGGELLAFLRRQAEDAGPGGALHVYTFAASSRDRGWLDAAGGHVIRHYWRMVIELPSSPAPAVVPLPAGVAVEQPADDEAELRVVHRVIDTAFLDHFGSAATEFADWHHRQSTSPGADLGLWWLARVAGEPAAVLIGRAWPDTGWVQGLGTLRAFRGRGLGRLLLQTAFAEFHRRGDRKVSLAVDATNPTGAVALYESVGMQVAYEALLYELPPLVSSVAE